MNSNIIELKKPKNGIDKFSVMIYPSCYFQGRNIGAREVDTYDYQVLNEQANRFEIYMPDLTLGYLNYLRLNKVFVKILNKNQLEWNNAIYERVK